MNVEEILRILRENVKQKGMDFRSIRLPKGNKNKETIKFDLENKILSIKLDKESLFANMQTNEAAFEGWALCLKSWLKDKDGVPMVDKVMIKWDVIKGIKSEHYARFLYRVRKFIENYDWADADNREYIYDINWISVNLPEKEAFMNVEQLIEEYIKKCNEGKSTKKNPEKIEEILFVKEKATSFKAIANQLPMRVYSESDMRTPGSFLDVWALTYDNQLNIYELKAEGNKSVGIISELMFYVNVVNDLVSGKLKFIDRAAKQNYRSFDALYEAISNKTIEKINGIMRIPKGELHPLISTDVLKAMNAMVNNSIGHPIVYSVEEYEIHKDKR